MPSKQLAVVTKNPTEINAFWAGKLSLGRVKMERLVSVTGSEPLFVSADSVTSECVPSQGRRAEQLGS